MDRSRLIFYFIATVAMMCFIFVAGCSTASPSSPGTTSTPSPTLTSTPAIATTLPPSPTVAVTQALPQAVVTTLAAITSDDITTHFLDLAFGSGNTQLYRLPNKASVNTPKNSISLFDGDASDLALIQDFVAQFNDLSATNKFSENIKSGNNADIVIQFVSSAGMDAIPTESYTQEYKSGGVSYAKIGPSTIYINSDLKGDIRNHIVLRSLLYVLGFRGESLKYPDSIFYYQDATNTKLSLIDQKAIQIMYSSGLYPGMTVADVRNVVYVKQ